MKSRILFVAAIAVTLTLFGLPGAWAHQNVPLRDASGNIISGDAGQRYTPYSPKMTCSGCHFDCDANASNGIAYCTTQLMTCDAQGQNPGSGSNLCTIDYGEGFVTYQKEQGYVGTDGKVHWTEYEVKSYEHGVSVGKHFNQGRNESYGHEERHAYGDLLFTSSPGMWGKY